VEDPATSHPRIEVDGLEVLVGGSWPAVMALAPLLGDEAR
jgi:hypothetical protein